MRYGILRWWRLSALRYEKRKFIGEMTRVVILALHGQRENMVRNWAERKQSQRTLLRLQSSLLFQGQIKT